MKKNRLLSIFASALVVAVSITFCMPAEADAYYDDDYIYTYYNSNYHDTGYSGLELHDYFTDDYEEEEYDNVIKKATLTSKGKCIENCWLCGASRTVRYSWSLDEPESMYNTSYNVIKSTVVYSNSKSVTVWLDHAKKGSVVKVKIGKKTYKKKVGNKKKIKIKIKNPKYGSKVRIKVYYKNKLIGKCYYYDSDEGEYCLDNDIVYYAKNIKKGMTKKQVKYLYYWGGPDDTASASGGWSYWYYDDGSSIGFKNGKVNYWYDAAG